MNKTQALANWEDLNTFLRSATEKQAIELLEAEKAGASRLTILLRIHSTVNKLRARREREEIKKIGMYTR
jgi:hypothetical protein